MNREIKFRAWNHESKRMFTPATIPNYIPEDGSIHQYLQFTGLKDKNGKEIYEGDILKVTHSNIKEEPLETVDFGSEHCDYETGGHCYGVYLEWPVEWYEVIGNIYENPELLNPAKD